MSTTIKASNSFVPVGSHADDTIVGNDDLISINGLATTLVVQGTNDEVTVTGTSQFAPNGQDDVILFQPGALMPFGTVVVGAYNRVDVRGDDITATLVGDDTFSLFGVIETIYANGTNDAVYVGRNGIGASGSNVDFVKGLTKGSVFEQQNSNVSVYGDDYTANLSGDDVFTAGGSGGHINALGTHDVVDITGGRSDDPYFVTFANAGVVNVADTGEDGAVQVFGNNVTLHGGAGSVLLGAGDTATLDGLLGFTVGGNLKTGAQDTVVFSTGFLSNSAYVVADSNVRFVGTGAVINAAGDDNVVAVGSRLTVGAMGKNNRVTIGGDGEFNGALGNAYVNVDFADLQPGDAAALLANSTVVAQNPNAPAGTFDRVVMAANDFLYADPGLNIFVPVQGGNDIISGFSAADRLVLASHFASAADVLAHTTNGPIGAVIQLDATGDTLTLRQDTTAQVAGFLSRGDIKFS